MDVNTVTLEAVAVRPEQYPQSDMPEIAFVGRSNVGKSSLINTMVNRKALARTSRTPGKTRTINFYNVENKLYFVDLPGYGYAKVAKEESRKWGSFIECYLKGREQLKAIVLLVDIRHEPSNNDKMMAEWLKHYGHSLLVVATKADKIKRSRLQKHCSVIRKGLNLAEGEILLPVSSLAKQGNKELWSYLQALLK